jgi:antitoxin (DNA-binding transcriptional repressor) of toxin-antitoxin stability system
MIMLIIMVMIMVNIAEAKARLSKYLDAVAGGETVVICNRNLPIAELRAVPRKRTEPRPIDGGPYRFSIPDSFFEPMPAGWLDELEGTPVFPEGSQRPSRVAERRPAYRTKKMSRRRS